MAIESQVFPLGEARMSCCPPAGVLYRPARHANPAWLPSWVS